MRNPWYRMACGWSEMSTTKDPLLGTYANKFQVDATAEETRISFGNAATGGEVSAHTTIVLSHRNALELANLILRLVTPAPQKTTVLN